MNAKRIEEMKSHALTGDYRSALALAKVAIKKEPGSLIYRYLYAKYLGDYADELPKARQVKMKREAVRLLKPLLRRLGGLPASERFGICLNYYYQAENFLAMYRFGRRFRRHDARQANYAIGLGAGLISMKLRTESVKRSRRWALVSAQAWEAYGLKNERYYFAHYSYAKALALAGQYRKASAALAKAAKLAHRPIDDWEFADVLALIPAT